MKIDKNKPVEDFTRQEWQYVLEKGAFRGKKINRAAKAIELNVFPSIVYSPEKQSIAVNKKFTININNIKRGQADWTVARLKYWIRKKVFCKSQTEHQKRIKNLANQIYDTFHPSQHSSPSPDRIQEKQLWKDYKESWKNLPSDDPTIDRLKEMTSQEHYNKLNETEFLEPHKELLARALKVKELYSETHYTFIHAQSLSYWVINQFVKELVRISNPDQDLSFYHFFRSEIDTKKVKTKEIVNQNINDGKTYFRKKLLSVDAYFFHLNRAETANDFLRSNKSDWYGEDTILQQILTSYLGVCNPKILNKLVELVKEYCRGQGIGQLGNLYAICVPKEKIDKIAFMAHPYGVPCKHESDPIHILNELQEDRIPQMKCKINICNIAPQFRIVTDQLNKKDTPIILISPVAKDIKDSFKVKLSEIAQETYALKQQANL